jgi:polysaccharide pyruvyl transferase CsaB
MNQHPPKKIFIVGSYGSTNIGDEVILSAIAKQIRRYLPGAVLKSTTGDCDYTAGFVPGVEPVFWVDFPKIVQEIESSDLIVCGGGGIFYDYWGNDPRTILSKRHWGISFVAGLPLLAAALRKPVVLYGVGVGPLFSEESRRLVGLLGNAATRITVRDERSREELIRAGVSPERIEVTADPAFAHFDEELQRPEKGAGEVQIAVALRNWNTGVSSDDWEHNVAEALEQFAKPLGATILFIPFQTNAHDDFINDLTVIRRVNDLIRYEKKTILSRDLPLPDLFNHFARSDLLVGMRFHSLIFAAGTRTPMVGLDYDPKIRSLMKEIGMEDLCLDIGSFTVSGMLDALTSAWNRRNELRMVLKEKGERLRLLAERNGLAAVDALQDEKPPALEVAGELTQWLAKALASHTASLSETEDRLAELISKDEAGERTFSDELSSHKRAAEDLREQVEFLKQKLHAMESTRVWQLGQSAGRWIRPESSLGRGLSHIVDRIVGREPPGISSPILQPELEVNPPVIERDSLPGPKRKSIPPRVAILTNRLLDWQTMKPRFGGGERYCFMIGSLLRDLGFEVTFYQAGLQEFEGEYYGFKVVGLPPGEGFSEFQYGICDRFYRQTIDYDHILYNLPEYASGRVRGDAVLISHGIWFDHNNYGPSVQYRTREWFHHLYRAFGQPKKIICNDTNTISVFRALWPELTPRMVYLPNFVDTGTFFPPVRRDGTGPITVIFPRRTQVNRGSRILGDILNRVPHDCRFIWAGEGDPEDTEILKALAQKDSRLQFLSASFEEMPPLYRQSDICVIPSIASEGTSLSCLEGLASGCAVVATHVGGLPNIIADGSNGLLVDPTAESIAKAINCLIENSRERARLQENGPESARKFSTGVWRSRWKNVLKELGWIGSQKAEPDRIRSAGGTAKHGMKIAIVTRNAMHGGVETLIALHQKYFRADVFVAGGYHFKDLCPFEYVYIPSENPERARSELETSLKKYDLIVYHWLPPWALEAIRESGKPSIEVVHRTDTAECDKSVPALLVAHSHFLAKFLRDCCRKDAAVIPYCIDLEKYPACNSGKYIGGLTSYYYTKGIDIFLMAWHKIEKQFPDQKVRFYGMGRHQPIFQQMADTLGLRQVEFLGPVRSPEQYLPEFSLFLCPSRIEGMPLAILEALACNIPVLCSDLPGMVEFNALAQGRGFAPPLLLAHTEDPEDLAEKLTQALSGQRPSLDTRSYLMEYYGVEDHCRQYREIFDKAITYGR